MRILKLTFAVLALMSVFTACTKDELPTQQEVAEVPGAKLLGTNLSADFTFDPLTKVDANGNWTTGDKLGLAWWNETLGGIYANHMFKLGEDGLFTTYGNVYEGWHFAYYPYVYENQIGGAKTVAINPEQKETIDKDIFTTRLHLSTIQNLTQKYNLEDDKLVNGYFKMRRAVKALNVALNPVEDITTSDALKDLRIKSVVLTAATGEQIFRTGNVTVDPTKLAAPLFTDADGKVVAPTVVEGVYTYPTATASFNEEKTAERFYNDLAATLTGATASNTITTVVNNEGINLGEKENIRFYTLPVEGVNPTASAMKLTVNVQNGYFEVAYTPAPAAPATLTEVQAKNNEQFVKLANAFKTVEGVKGYLAEYSPEHEATLGLGLDFVLTADMFHQSFNSIESEEDWNAAVAMVDALGIKTPTFTIVHGTNPWKFEDVDEDGNLVNLPTSSTLTKLIVDGGSMYLNKENANMPATSNKFVINTNVVVEKDLNVAGKFEVATGKTIKNNATIYAGPAADIISLNNVGKRVVVAYGARVANDAAANKGTVAYIVNSVAQDDIAKVRTMITEPKIKVNTLVVDGVALDLNAKCVAAGGNGYNNTDAEYLSEGNATADLTYELVNGGSLTANNTDMAASKRSYNVSAVIAKSGNTTITDIHPVDSLVVKAGVMTATDIELCGAEVITVAENATLNINSTEDTESYVSELNVNGTVNVNINGLTANKVIVNASGALNISGYNYFVWGEQSDLRGTTSGTIVRGAKDEDVLRALISLADGKPIYLAQDITLTQPLNITKNIALNLNGKKLTGSILASANLEVMEGEIVNTTATSSAIEVTGEAKLNLTNVDIESARHAVRVESTGAVVINGGTYTVTDGGHMTQYAVNIGTSTIKADVTIKGGKFIGPKALPVNKGAAVCVQGTSKLTIEGGEFSGAKNMDVVCKDSGASIVCKGGKYEGFNPTSYLATGFESKAITSGTYNGWFEVKAK